MITSIGEFNERYGEKALFAGVYSINPDDMIREVRFLFSRGFNVYLEALSARKNCDLIDENYAALDTVIKYFSRNRTMKFEGRDLKLGINFPLVSDCAYQLANEYEIVSFVINDAFCPEGIETMLEHTSPLHSLRDLTSTQGLQDRNFDIFLGNTPGYLNYKDQYSWDSEMGHLVANADAVVIGNYRDTKAIDRVDEHREYGRPLILGQGIDLNNVKDALRNSDAVFMGSGLRGIDGEVNGLHLQCVQRNRRELLEE